MALIPAKVIWITDKNGVVAEEYQGKWSLKAVHKYESQGQEKVSYDWVYREKWNPETRKREIPAKANCAQGVFLGDLPQAIKILESVLLSLGSAPAPKDFEELPF